MAPSRSTAPVVERPWPAEVTAFATEQGVEQFLAPLLDATRKNFPTARRFEVYLEDDPEMVNERHIVFKVELAGMAVSPAVEAHSRWHRDLLACCPGSQVCLFQLDMELVN